MALMDRLFGRANADTQLSLIHSDIRRWQDIYNGGGDWRYTRKGGMNGGTRRVASLGAAKALCAELARLCFTESTGICCADKETEAFLRKVLAENDFRERFAEFLEKVFALGGGAVRVYWDGGVKLDFTQADEFFPTEWDSSRITGGVFVSKLFRGGRSYTLAQEQHCESNDLIMKNTLFDDSGKQCDLKKAETGLPEESRIKGIGRPLFVYFRANSGGYAQCRPLGGSVFGGAEDTLRGIDTVFDSLMREFVLGRKRIIVPYYAVKGEYDENGDIRRYFDTSDEVFQAMSVSDEQELKIIDNTAQLRVEEHTTALCSLLDLLCMQAGLSEGSLSYKNGTLRTATEVVSRNSRTYRTQAYLRSIITEALQQVMADICLIGRMAGLLSEQASDSVSVMFADGAAEDDTTRTDRAIRLYNAGLISRTAALSQIYGIAPEDTQAIERMNDNG